MSPLDATKLRITLRAPNGEEYRTWTTEDWPEATREELKRLAWHLADVADTKSRGLEEKGDEALQQGLTEKDARGKEVNV